MIDHTDKLMQNLLRGQAEYIAGRVDMLNRELKGKKVRILSKWNGQPWGKSRPSLQGKEFEIDRVCIDSWETASFCIFLKGERTSIRPESLEFLCSE